MRTLSDFFCHPAKFLAVKRLGLRLLPEAAAMDERETFTVEGLDRYQLQQELLERKLSGRNLEDSRGLTRASGRLPAGISGNAQFAQVRREVEDFYQRLEPFHPGKFEPPSSFELPVGEFVLSGHFTRITPEGLLFYRPATIKPKDLLRAWVEHLLYNAFRFGGKSSQTVIVGAESTWKLAPISAPQPLLTELIERYWTGLCQPLKFFPESSYAFAAADYKVVTGTQGRTVKTPIDFAHLKWNGSDFGPPGEREDEYFALFFKNEDSLDGDFETLARAVFRPLLENAEEVQA